MEKERLTKKKLRAKREGNRRQLAEATDDLGNLYFRTGNIVKALEEYSESLEAYKSLGEKFKCVLTQRKIGETNAALGKYECALKHINLHVEGVREFENELEEQRGLATLGRTYFLLAHTFPENSDKRIEPLANAKKAYDKSMQLCLGLEGIDAVESLTMRARLLLNQGLVQVAQNEHNEGISMIKSAIKVFSADKGSDELHKAYITLGAIHEKQGNNQEALNILDRAAENENISKKVDTLLIKAQLLLKIGQWLDARRVLVAFYPNKNLSQSLRNQLEKLLRIAVTLCRGEEKLKSSRNEELNYLALYEDLGDAAAAVNCYDKALEYYKQMLSCAESNKSKEKVMAALVSLAQTYKDAGQYKEALPYANRELKMCSDDPREACKTALLLTDLLESSGARNSDIHDMYKLALSEAGISGEPSLELTVLKEYRHYLEGQKTEIDTRLKVLMDTPGLESEKEIISTPDIGADICLDELSDFEPAEEERTKIKPSRPKSRCSRRSDYVVKRNRKGESQLHIACMSRNIERVRKLLEDGHPTNIKDNCNWTPLHEAANYGSSEIVMLLVEAGANINDRGGDCESITPLHDAADCGNFDVMNFLIENGADIRAITKQGNSVLDHLEEWRKRVKNWSDAAETQYRYFCNKLVRQGVPKRKSLQNNKFNKGINIRIHISRNKKRISFDNRHED